MSDAAFRDDVRAWLQANAPESLRGTRGGRFDGWWGGRRSKPPTADQELWRDRMLERGFIAPQWPKELGGGGLSRREAEILDEEMDHLQVPPAVVGFGLQMIGPTLLDYGSDTLKAQHIPAIVRGDVRWCQGYSEPNAGSDLASLQMRAVRDGDEFVVNGQKVWTSHADESDWIFCLVRTDPDAPRKQQGITFLLVDMLQPGVRVREIPLISGASPFCEVFFEDVRVPIANVVGDIDNGWTVAKALLGYERTMIGSSIGTDLADAERQLVALARTEIGPDDGELADPDVRRDIAAWAMRAKCFDLTTQRIAQEKAAGQKPGAESSIGKVVGSELKQKRWELATAIAGPQALGWQGPGFDEENLSMTRDWLRSRANTIEGGSSEIQLNVIAKRVLGLPS